MWKSSPVGLKSREMRGPIETHEVGNPVEMGIPGLKPREMRGPIETPVPATARPDGTVVSSRAKCAALLKQLSCWPLRCATCPGLKPREMRGPIETPVPEICPFPPFWGLKPREMRGPIETYPTGE